MSKSLRFFPGELSFIPASVKVFIQAVCFLSTQPLPTSSFLYSMSDDIEKANSTQRTESKFHVWWAELFPLTIVLIADVLVCMYFVDTKRATWKYPTYSYVYGTCCILWYIFLVACRTYYAGVAGFYDAYWFCNIGMLLTGLGAFLSLPTLVGQAICLLLIPHILFWIDFIFYPCFKRCVVGVYPYMFDENEPMYEKVTSYHHFWFFPGMIFLLVGQPPITLMSLCLSVILFFFLMLLAHYLTPLDYPRRDGTSRYLNVCCAHEYPEIVRSIPPFKYAIGKSFALYIFINIIFYTIPFNFFSYLLAFIIQKLFS